LLIAYEEMIKEMAPKIKSYEVVWEWA